MTDAIESLVWDILNDGEVSHCADMLRAALDAAVEAEREACRKECHFVADQHISTELRNVAFQCEAAVWSRSISTLYGEG